MSDEIRKAIYDVSEREYLGLTEIEVDLLVEAVSKAIDHVRSAGEVVQPEGVIWAIDEDGDVWVKDRAGRWNLAYWGTGTPLWTLQTSTGPGVTTESLIVDLNANFFLRRVQ